MALKLMIGQVVRLSRRCNSERSASSMHGAGGLGRSRLMKALGSLGVAIVFGVVEGQLHVLRQPGFRRAVLWS